MDDHYLRGLFEALLFVSPNPLTLPELTALFDKSQADEIEAAFFRFMELYNAKESGLQIVAVAGGFRLLTKPGYEIYIKKLYTVQSKSKLTRASLETLAIIVYKQPITCPEIENIRGTDSSGVLKTLLDRELITILGRKKAPGNPLLYGTTSKFLIDFGLSDLSALPTLEDYEKLTKQVEA